MGQRLIEVGDRVRHLTEERDAAIRADHDKLRFVAAASHDLRQPMHALGLFVATLEGRLQGTPDEPLTHSMMRSVETLDRSFTALLDISRLDAGTVCPNLQRFPLRDLFRRLHMHFAGLAEEHGLGLRFSPGGKTVTSDPQLLERILANLIQNALRYTREGGVVVLARTTRSHIHVEVWDSGCGISAADLPHIFDEFYRAGHAGRDAAQGLGMGLAIVKRLAVLLGLTLEVASRPGRGTMFRVGIPIGSAPDVADATAAADTIPAPVLQAGTILVIDDEADIRDGLATLLRSWGFDAHAAADIAAARSVAQVLDGQLDLVISDLHLLDGEDGLDAVAAVRQACGRRVPAMIVTGDTSPAEIRRASASGNMVLFKPLQPSKLFGVLRSIVR
jgi:CheY-like chemotaxis protein